jgi:hypothetical protein
MSDDLIERLSVDFRMMRTYDDPTGPFVRYQDHAQALTEARAEIERLRAGINGIVNCQGPMTRAQVREACAEILGNKTVGLDNQSPFAEAMFGYKTRALAAESELSTLRARVREVVGLGLDVISEERGWGTYPRMEGSEIYTDADVFSRAARQLMEEVK